MVGSLRTLQLGRRGQRYLGVRGGIGGSGDCRSECRRRSRRSRRPGRNHQAAFRSTARKPRQRDVVQRDCRRRPAGQRSRRITCVRNGTLQSIEAKAAIVAAPKFIARRIVEGFPAAQSSAMAQIRYAPYVVVNLVFERPVFNGGYDTGLRQRHIHRCHCRRLGDPPETGIPTPQ